MKPVPCRNRPPLKWSNVTSITNSGRRGSRSVERLVLQRLEPGGALAHPRDYASGVVVGAVGGCQQGQDEEREYGHRVLEERGKGDRTHLPDRREFLGAVLIGRACRLTLFSSLLCASVGTN